MASAQSLIGLVNHLQSMESTFATVMMEAVMKLASLTDSNVFLMVETAEGRRFCGKRHLCDQYLHGGGLLPIGNDIEMDVDVNVTGVREKSLLGGGASLPQNYHHSGTSNIGMQGWSNAQPTGRKRPSNYSNPSYSKHQKMAQQQAMAAAAAVIQQQQQQQQKDHVKSETERDRGGEGGDENVVVDRENAGEGEEQRARDGGGEAGNCTTVSPWSANLVSGNAYQGFHGNMTSGPVANINVNNEQLVVDEKTIEVLLTQNSKADILRSVIDPECLRDRESSIVKLLNSHLYDVAKGGANFCPIRCRKDPRCRYFFRTLFEGWWNAFPNFQDLSSQGVKVEQNNATLKPLKTYIRTRMQANFGWAIEYMAKSKPVSLE